MELYVSLVNIRNSYRVTKPATMQESKKFPNIFAIKFQSDISLVFIAGMAFNVIIRLVGNDAGTTKY